MALGKRERVYRKGSAINVEVPRTKPEPVHLIPLCNRIATAPPNAAVLGVEENGTPLMVRLTCAGSVAYSHRRHNRFRQDGVESALAAHIAGDVQQAG